LGAWFGSFNQYKSGGADVSHWLSMHGARSLKIDRKTGDPKTIYIPHAAVSVTGTIQPDTLRRALLPEFFDNGLAARLLVAMPPTRAKKWSEAEISDAAQTAFDGLFDRLFDLRPADGPDGPEPIMVDLLPDALERWIQFVNEHNEAMQELDGHGRAAWAKLEGYAARFALIFHCVRQAAGAKDSDHVDLEDIGYGIALTQWFGAETLRVYRAMTQSDEDRQKNELLAWIADRGGRVTVRDLTHGLRRYRDQADQAETDLNSLVTEARGSWAHVRSGPTGGRSVDVFCLAESPDFSISGRVTVTDTPKNTGKSEVVESVTPQDGKEIGPAGRIRI
jgi:hypothetical protein